MKNNTNPIKFLNNRIKQLDNAILLLQEHIEEAKAKQESYKDMRVHCLLAREQEIAEAEKRKRATKNEKQAKKMEQEMLEQITGSNSNG